MKLLIHTQSFLLGMVFAWVASYALAALYELITGNDK
jgi:hypothetical protein